ncbi:hypothetical protein SBADM41S_08500 [Streptomyces badius]
MTAAETYAAGYANAAKLDGAAALGPAFMKVVLNKRYINDSCASTVDVSSEVDFDYRGKRQLPPTKATFLSYGFMPTTATMTLEQVGPPAAIHTRTPVTNTPTYPEETTVTAQLVMRLSDVEVNGVPLDVGPDCRTERPFEQVLKGYGQSYPPGRLPRGVRRHPDRVRPHPALRGVRCDRGPRPDLHLGHLQPGPRRPTTTPR